MPDTPILTVDEFKLAENLPLTDHEPDAKIEQGIRLVGAAIKRATDRDFGAEVVTTTRRYDYNGGGIVNIDDCSTITSVKLNGRMLAGTEFTAQPQNDDVFFWIDLYASPNRFGSPEMGFTRNEDTYSGPRREVRSYVEVQASFGWATVPDDVKLAALEMMRAIIDMPQDEIQSESVAEWSVSNKADEFSTGRWPSRVKDLLGPYRRINM